MLSNLKVHPTIAAKDIARAKKFYEEKLGLKPYDESPVGLFYKVGEGTEFLLYPTPTAGTAQNTVMNFVTTDIKKEVADLKANGVVFEEYDTEHIKTVDGIVSESFGMAAWFKDSEGNIIGLSQLA